MTYITWSLRTFLCLSLLACAACAPRADDIMGNSTYNDATRGNVSTPAYVLSP